MNTILVRNFSVDEKSAGVRLDLFLSAGFAHAHLDPGFSRAEIQRLIAEGQVTLNGSVSKPSARLKARDKIVVRTLPVRDTSVQPEALPLDILYEDADCLVVNKAPGIVVHPAAGQRNGTLVNALLYHCADLAGIGGERRPGIVHRLDKETSGVMIVAKNMFTFQHLVGQFKNRTVQKEYVGLAWGAMNPTEGRIDRPIGRHRSDRKRMSSLQILNRGRDAVTEWCVEERLALTDGNSYSWVSLVRLRPRTGRTHQLRVHLADMGFPLIGDKVYGAKRRRSLDLCPAVSNFPRQALHAEKLVIDHVRTGQRMEFTAPLSDDMARLLSDLRQSSSIPQTLSGRNFYGGVDKERGFT